MYDRNVKSERILTKLRVLDDEYICDRTAKFHKKILFITRVINIQILTTKYFSFQQRYILQSGTQASGSLLRTRSRFCRSVMVSVAVSTLGRTDLFFVDPGTKVNGQYYLDILLRQQLAYCQPFVVCLATSLLFNKTTLLPTEHVRQCIC